MNNDINFYKNLLEKKYSEIKNQLDSLGRVHSDNKNDYDTVSENLDTDLSEREEVAEKIESFETRSALEAEFEKKLNEISAALDSIKNGTYGKCIICGKEIDEKRLEINPTAISCTECYGDLDISSTL